MKRNVAGTLKGDDLSLIFSPILLVNNTLSESVYRHDPVL